MAVCVVKGHSCELFIVSVKNLLKMEPAVLVVKIRSSAKVRVKSELLEVLDDV